MAQNGAYQEFLKRLQREWAIETGIIERLYSWDRGVTEVLVKSGIEAAVISHQGGLTREAAEHVKDLIDDQLGIVEGLFGYVKGETPLTEHFIRTLQAEFTAHQEYTDAINADGKIVRIPMLRGEYKKSPNNPRRADGLIYEYCPPELVCDEMQHLIGWYQNAESLVAPEVLAAWLHHRFTQIHPFQDGNGRVARSLASLVFLRAGLFPLVIRDAERVEYITALEMADAGDLSALVVLFAKRQRDAILSALGIDQQVQQSKHADQIISSAMILLKDRFAKEVKRLEGVYTTANTLQKAAQDRLQSLTDILNKELAHVTPPGHRPYTARMTSADNKSDKRAYHYRQIIDTAHEFQYFVNVDKYRSWARLAISTEQTFEYVVSIHGYGHGETGIMAVSAFTQLRVPREEGQGSDAVETRAAAIDLFQFNYAESVESTQERFDAWLEASAAIALDQWRRTLSLS